MLTPRVLKISLLRRLGAARAAELPPPWRPRVFPVRGYHSRGYSNGGSSKYDRPMRQFAEENESNPQPLIYYIIPSALLAFFGLATYVHYNDEKRVVPLESKYDIKITLLFITIDPQRDSPAQLKAYLRELGPRIIGLTGSINAVRQIAQEYRVFF